VNKWPGFHQDREPERMQQERQRAEQIKADNLSARVRADFQPGRIDPASGRTFADARARGMYDDATRLRDFREMNDRNRDTRQRFRWAEARTQGRRGRN
jgi:hypothetical protein